MNEDAKVEKKEDPMVLKLVKELHQAQSVAGYAKSNLEFMTVMCDLMAEDLAKAQTGGWTSKEVIEAYTIKTYEKLKTAKT